METFDWQDELSSAKAIVVLDTVKNGVSAGLLRVFPTGVSMTREHALSLGKQASLSAAVASPLIGGAVVCLSADLDVLDNVLDRFVFHHRTLFANALALQGETDEVSLRLDESCRQLGLTGAQHALALQFARATSQPDAGKMFGTGLSFLSAKVDFSKLAIAYGLSQIINTLEEITPLKSPPRVVIDGFGSPGSSLAYFIHLLKVGTVVAVRDEDGWIARAEGLPVLELLRIRSASMDRRRELGETREERHHAGSRMLCHLDDKQRVEFKAETKLPLRAAAADVLVLCRGDTPLQTEEDIAALLPIMDSENVRFLFPAADELRLEKLFESQEQFAAARMAVVPPWLCRVGREQAARSLVTMPFTLNPEDRWSGISAVLESLSVPITTFVIEAYYTYCEDRKVLSFADGCTKLATHRIEEAAPPFVKVAPGKRELHIEVFRDAAKVQDMIQHMTAAVKRLCRALLADKHSDDPLRAVQVALVEDLVGFYVFPQLEFLYGSSVPDSGERKNKRVAVRVLEGIDHFLAACCKAQKELQSEKQRLAGDVCADCVEKLRPADGPQTETESAQQLIKKFDLPLTPGTLTRLLEVLFGAHLPLLAAEESLARAAASMEEQSAFEDKKMSEEAVRKAEQDYARSEHHAAELGGGVGGVMVRFCELAQLPALVQVGLKAFVFFFGRCLVGKTVDRMMEPSIRDDVAALEQAARVAEACQSAPRVSSPEDAENRITAKLEKLMPPIPLAGTAPRQLSHALVQILGNDRLMRELVYFYIFPSLLVNL